MLYPDYGRPGCFALCRSGHLLFAFEHGFAKYDPDSQHMEFYGKCGRAWKQDELVASGFAVRLNDGRVDRAGRLVVGGINFTGIAQGGEEWTAVQPCYSVEATDTSSDGIYNKLKLSLLDNMPLVRITNGICFSLCGSRMFHCDSGSKEIRVFDYDTYTGQLTACEDGYYGRVIASAAGTPDGSIVDSG
jgi:L-arabinonolactonase